MKLKTSLIIGIASLLVMLLISSCSNEGPSCEEDSVYQIKDGVILLDKEGVIPCDQCDERELNDQIIILESKYCGACQAVLPIIKEVAAEVGVSILDLDISESTAQDQMTQLKVMPYYTPTMLVGCQVYVGGKTKAEYTKIFSDFLEK